MNDIYNYLYYHEKLSSGGMPTPGQLTAAANAGVQVIINLATDNSEGAIPNEGGIVTGLGMRYIHIPVDWNNPTRQDLDRFMGAMEKHAQEKVLVHCQANYRASGFIALYRILRLGWKPKDALADMHKIWNEAKYPVWQAFITESAGRGWSGQSVASP